MRQILDRYFFNEFLKYFTGALTLLVGVAMISKVMERLNVFLEYHGPVWEIFHYLSLLLPYFITIVGAPALMFAISFNVAYFAHNKELIVAMAAGRSFNRIMLPIFIFTFVFSVGFFYFNELVSYPNYYKSFFKLQELRGIANYGKIAHRFDYHARIGDNFIHAGKFEPKGNMVVFFHMLERKNNRISGIIESQFAIIIPNQWILINGKETTFDENGNFVKTERFRAQHLPMKEGPEAFGRLRQDFEEMNVYDIQREIQNKKTLGINYREHEVELYWHYSFPFVCFFIVFIASYFGSKVKKGAMSSSIGISTAFTLIYYMIMFFGKSLAVRGILSPQVGAWLANILFTILSLFLFYRNRQ